MPAEPARFDTTRRPARFLTCDLRDFSDMHVWARGALLCSALCGSALMFAPEIEPVGRARAMPARQVQQSEPELAPIAPSAPQRPASYRPPPVLPAERAPTRLEGNVGTGLEESLRAAAVPEAIADEFVKALATKTDIAQLRPDDRFDLVVERPDRLLMISVSRAGVPPLRLMKWRVGGRDEWRSDTAAPAATAAATSPLSRPVSGRITSAFGQRRHPILGYKRFHRGVDIGAPQGAPIRAVADGQVTFAGWRGGYGKQVRISHGGGLASSYSHMSGIAARSGASVRKGDIIGRVGWTGLATGPHLHYELFRNGRAIDPAATVLASAPVAATQGGSDFERAFRRLRSAPLSR